MAQQTSLCFVGGGFIRPEVRTFVNLGKVTSINAERGNLGTDKSVPYIKRGCFVVRGFAVANCVGFIVRAFAVAERDG
ncbi:MAG: hypothetical protein FWG87_04115 [Defluviitaleaceae bacterium]|nr:hypothetical protein [Defluviitaleaceae bacterium]